MPNLVRFSDGSLVKWVDRETLQYSDSSHIVLIWVDFEPGFFSNGRIIKASSISKWDSFPSNEAPEISDEIKEQIIAKVSEYWKQNKKKCRIET
jgi:hypothetical protein